MKQKNPLLYFTILIFPISMWLMHVNPVIYFFGIVISFFSILIQSMKDLSKYRSYDVSQSQASLKRLMLVVGLYLLGGFAALFFL